jgi:salicylate biosynthesis isochorismate synthase
VRELVHTPDLVELAGAARDAGYEASLIERPMPDAVSIAALGRRFDIVSTGDGAAVEDAGGTRIDEERGVQPLVAAHRLWARLAPGLAGGEPPGLAGTGPVAVGGFAFDPTREPGGPWLGFPALLFRVPLLAVARVRGRTFAWGDDEILDLEAGLRAPAARQLEAEPQRPPEEWKLAVATAAERLRRGEAEKVVLAREVLVRADGVISAAAVARALRSGYPSCFTYLIGGDDGSVFIGASPELLIRRMGDRATSQPMAGSIARGRDESEDRILAERLQTSAKDAAEHRVSARQVAASLAPLSRQVRAGEPELVRFTNIQHLATTVEAELCDPPAGLLELAAALHPTPAINGMPPAAAARLIAELEGMERGWYTGAVGWMDARCDGELAIAIRCGLLCPEGARLFAGNGMMPASDPDSELRETETKLRVLLGALGS